MLPIGAAARIPQKPSAVNSFQRIGQQPFTSLFTTVRHPTRSKSSLSPHNVNTKPRLSLESQKLPTVRRSLRRWHKMVSCAGFPVTDPGEPPREGYPYTARGCSTKLLDRGSFRRLCYSFGFCVGDLTKKTVVRLGYSG